MFLEFPASENSTLWLVAQRKLSMKSMICMKWLKSWRIRLNFYGWKGNFAFGEWFEMAFHQDMLYPQRMYSQWLVILAYFDRNGSYSSDKFAPILVPVPAFKMVFSEYRNLFFSYRWGGNCPHRPADNNWDFYWGNCLPVLDNSGNAEFNYDEIPAFVLCQMCSVLMQW